MEKCVGAKQDVILAKLGGAAARTNVAGGMSGSPVYIDGRLTGAIALRLSVFSPDTICGITPIENMLEIDEIDCSRPSDARGPASPAALTGLAAPGELLAAAAPRLGGTNASFVPIGLPLGFSGFHPRLSNNSSRCSSSWASRRCWAERAAIYLLEARPGLGESVAAGAGDRRGFGERRLPITGLGTVTYNDGRRVLAFGQGFLASVRFRCR